MPLVVELFMKFILLSSYLYFTDFISLLLPFPTMSADKKIQTFKGVSYDCSGSSHNVIDCIFCRIQRHKEPATIVYEDEKYVVFKTIQPATKLHLLVTPRKHIRNLDSLLTKKDAEIVQDMMNVGEIAIKIVDGKASSVPIQFCFHVPPYNSIDHLHLHAIGYPNQMNPRGFIKYNTYMPYCELAETTLKRLLKSEY